MSLINIKRGFKEIYNLEEPPEEPLYEPEKRRKVETVRCKFKGYIHDVEIIQKTIEDGNEILFSKLFQIEIIEGYHTATLRNNLCIRILEKNEFEFVESSKTDTPPPVVLGSGSYGIVFKIMGVDEKWYVVKSFDDKKSALDEWTLLERVSGTHKCIQQAVGCQIDRNGDLNHIIVSEYQGNYTFSRFHSIPGVNIMTIIILFKSLASGLREIHDKGILHADIKPDNIILENNNGSCTPIFIDFGIACELGKQTICPNSYFTWWFRHLRLFLNEYIRCFPFVDSTVKLSSIMDWWAFFMTMIRVFSRQPIFLGFGIESETRLNMAKHSVSLWLMRTMYSLLGEQIKDISIVQIIYSVLWKKAGPEKFLEAFKNAGISLDNSEQIYEKLVIEFHKRRDEHPMTKQAKIIANQFTCENPDVNISEIRNLLEVFFLEILRDGGELSIIDALDMRHIEHWFTRLEEISEMIREIGHPIRF